MARSLRLALASGALVAGIAVAATPSLFGKSQPGMWELSGLQGAKAPSRLCLSDLSQLALVEHRGRRCGQRVLRENPSTAIFTYECGPNEFGRTEISFVTPRNFKIVSQGIAGGLPFAHTVQARRLGDCPAKSPQTGH